MRELVLKMSMSLDGFVAAPRADSDWNLRASTPDSAAWVLETLSGAGTHAIGRRLFEAWAGFWPTSPSPMAKPINEIPKVVFTRQASFTPAAAAGDSDSDSDSDSDGDSAASAEDAASGDGRARGDGAEPTSNGSGWGESRVANGDLADEVGRLKEEPGDYILAQGGVGFARSLVQAGLVDEYRLVVLPVALGSGEQLFSGLTDELDLELVSSTAFSGGVLGNVYRPRLA
ncbi:dihydrofolate reductase family protein [Subtercola sp. YIM 133946]|uniref:dihydrofolate reductase family protein n=1 Tax=Subtercola sp. YIM 133946 TaxID=3118909 RepID=UPI002F94D822